MCCFLLGTHVFSLKPLHTFTDLAKPTQIDIRGEELYVLEEAEVKVYSLKNFQFLRKFGKKGEGPGELIPNPEIPLQMNLFKENITLNSPYKRITFSKTGKILGESSVTFFTSQIIPFDNKFIVVKNKPSDQGEVHSHVLLLDSQLKELKTLYIYKGLISFKKGKIVIPPRLVFIRSSLDRIFVMSHGNDFQIDIFDPRGNALKPIKMDYPKIELTGAYKKEITGWLKLQPIFKAVPAAIVKMLYFSENLPTIRNFLVKDKKVYVQTYKKKVEQGEFFIFDFNGKLLKKVYLPGITTPVQTNPNTTYTVKGNKYYYLIENIESEKWELHAKEIN
jgi:hypothetical protein